MPAQLYHPALATNLRQTKMTNANPGPISRYVFDTTGYIDTPDSEAVYKFTHVRLEDAVQANFMTREVVTRLGLTAKALRAPRNFTIPNGPAFSCANEVTFSPFLGGVYAKHVNAFVIEAHYARPIILGSTGRQQFLVRVQVKDSKGSTEREERVTVAEDVAGNRRHRILLDRDSPSSSPTITRLDYEAGIRAAKQFGDTVRLRQAKESLCHPRSKVSKSAKRVEALRRRVRKRHRRSTSAS